MIEKSHKPALYGDIDKLTTGQLLILEHSYSLTLFSKELTYKQRKDMFICRSIVCTELALRGLDNYVGEQNAIRAKQWGAVLS